MTYYQLDYSQKLDFIKRLILTHMTDEYPYYACKVTDTEYECCFASGFEYRDNYNSLYLSNPKNYFNIKSTPKDNSYSTYTTTKEYNKRCLFYSPNSSMPAMGNIDNNNSEFMNFSNFDFSFMKDTYYHFYITDLLATTTSSTSVVDDGGGSTTSSNTDTLLILISGILLLIFITGFIRSCFFKR